MTATANPVYDLRSQPFGRRTFFHCQPPHVLRRAPATLFHLPFRPRWTHLRLPAWVRPNLFAGD
jgi:hypothetical protein